MSVTAQFGDAVAMTFPAEPKVVWRIVSDLQRIGEWSPECYGVRWVSPWQKPELGAQFVGLNRIGPLRWQTTCTIMEWQPVRQFAYLARHRTGAVTRWQFELHAVPEGTRVTQSFQTVGSPKGIMLVDRLARRGPRLQRGMAQTLGGMRRAITSEE